MGLKLLSYMPLASVHQGRTGANNCRVACYGRWVVSPPDFEPIAPHTP